MRFFRIRSALRALLAIFGVAAITTISLNYFFGQSIDDQSIDGQSASSPSNKAPYSHTIQEQQHQSLATAKQGQDSRTQIRSLLQELEDSELSELITVPQIVTVRGSGVIVDRDSPAYERAFMRLRFVFVKDEGNFDDDRKKRSLSSRNETKGWMVLLCLVDNDGGEDCLQKESYVALDSYQKVSKIPGLRETLWKKDRLCSTMHAAHIYTFLQEDDSKDSLCWILPSQFNQFLNVVDAMDSSSLWIIKSTSQGRGAGVRLLTKMEIFQEKESFRKHRAIAQTYFSDQLKIEGMPVSIRAYVLVTSVLPLRVYLYNEGSVIFRGGPNIRFKKIAGRLWYFKQLRDYLDMKYGAEVVVKAFESIESAIVRVLLIAQPVLAEGFEGMRSAQGSVYRCVHCFQLLGIDLMLNSDFHALIVEVDGQPNLSETDEDSSWASNSIKESMVQDALQTLFVRKRVASEVAKTLDTLPGVDIAGINCEPDAKFCLNKDDLLYLLNSRRESKRLGDFLKIYPSVKGEKYSLLVDLINRKKERQPSGLQHFMNNEMHNFLTQLENQYESLSNQEKFSFKPLFKADFAKRFTRENYDLLGSKDKEFHNCVQDATAKPYLSLLSITPGTLNPPFHPERTVYTIHIPNEVVLIRIKAKAAHCDSEARLQSKVGTPMPSNWSLNVGLNVLKYYIIDLSHTVPWTLSQYYIQIIREDLFASEDEFDAASPHKVCSFIQECDFALLPRQPCDVQKTSYSSWRTFWEMVRILPECRGGDAQGRWILPCGSCEKRATCFWRKASWVPYKCQHSTLSQRNLRLCLAGRKVIFLGDSTLRGMMYYMIEKVNSTLSVWDKSHDAVTFTNLHGPHSVMFSYFPAFWLPEGESPVLEKVLYSLLRTSMPLKNSKETVLVVGGLQWLNHHHLSVIDSLLSRMGLKNAAVIIKGYGTGFNQPVKGIRFKNLDEHKKVLRTDRGLAKSAQDFGFHFVSTFNVTFPRYKHFLYGACGCHFHSVIDTDSETEENLGATYKKKSGYHVTGPVNAVYTEIMNKLLCLSD